MSDQAAPASETERIRLLEEALADYASRYGLTERARALLTGPQAVVTESPVMAGLASRFPPFRAMIRAKLA